MNAYSRVTGRSENHSRREENEDEYIDRDSQALDAAGSSFALDAAESPISQSYLRQRQQDSPKLYSSLEEQTERVQAYAANHKRMREQLDNSIKSFRGVLCPD